MSDYVEVTRCRDCAYWNDHAEIKPWFAAGEFQICDFWSNAGYGCNPIFSFGNDYCSHAERKDDATDL